MGDLCDNQNFTSSPRVQDMLQKFEANVPASSPVYARTSSLRKNKVKLPVSCDSRQDVRKNDNVIKKEGKIFKCENEETSVPPKVSVEQRAKLFQGLRDKEVAETQRNSPPTKNQSESCGITSTFGPLPCGPPPSKPPRASVKHNKNARESSNANASPNKSVNVNNNILASVSPEKFSIKSVINTSTNTEKPATKAEKPVSFLHSNLNRKAANANHICEERVPLTVSVANSDDKPMYQSANGGPTSPRTRSIKRPKVPPPRPPPPSRVHDGNSQFNSPSMITSLYESKTCNDASQFESCLYDEVPQEYGVNKMFNLRRSISDEKLYAVPSGLPPNLHKPKVKSLPKSEYAVPYEVINLKNTKTPELHYMSTPIPGWDKKKLPPTPKSHRKMKTAVRDLVNQSFSKIRKTFKRNEEINEDDSDESDGEVSVKDVQDRIIYVQSFRKKPLDPADVVENKKKLFEYLLVIGLEWIESAATYHPTIISQFPEQYEFKHDKMLISRFCYPDSESWKPVSVYQSETYSFVLTDEKGSQTFAYCKRMLPQCDKPCTPVVYCLVCSERDFNFYSKVLDELEKRGHHPEIVMNVFLSNLYKHKLPEPSLPLTFIDKTEDGEENVTIARSTDPQMESVEFFHLLKALDVENLLKAFSSMLLERRVLFCANTLAVLTNCVQAMAALLYPFCWQHTLVPVIPENMLDLCSMPTPYVMGVLSSCIHKVTALPLDDVLIVDLDHSRMIREIGDENTIIPRKIQAALSTALCLANNMTDPTASSLTLMMCEAFVQMFVRTVGHFENHIVRTSSGELKFERDSFCKAPYSRGVQMFLKWFCETQTFDVFIHNRLEEGGSRRRRNSAHDGLFDRRAQEYREEMEQLSQTFKGNVREISKKVKDLGDKIRNLRAF